MAHAEVLLTEPHPSLRQGIWRLCLLCVAVLLPSALSMAQGNSELRWDAETSIVRVGESVESVDDSRLRVRLNDAGFAVVELPTGSANLSRLTDLHVAVGSIAPRVDVSVFWWTKIGEDLASHRLIAGNDGGYRADMSAVDKWPQFIPAVALRIEGTPGTVLDIGPVELKPIYDMAFFWFVLKAAYVPAPWTQSSVNTHGMATTRIGKFNLLEWTGLGVFICGAAVTLLGFIGKRRSPRRLLLLACVLGWVFLDTVWINHLYFRSVSSIQAFAGKSDKEKLAASIDAATARIAEDLRSSIPRAARIFVASEDDWTGNRLSYYLYPRNVYWQRGGPELPGADALRAGDFVVLASPTQLRLLTRTASPQLVFPGGEVADVIVRYSRSRVTLLEIRE